MIVECMIYKNTCTIKTQKNMTAIDIKVKGQEDPLVMI